eukprot:UN13410
MVSVVVFFLFFRRFMTYFLYYIIIIYRNTGNGSIVSFHLTPSIIFVGHFLLFHSFFFRHMCFFDWFRHILHHFDFGHIWYYSGHILSHFNFFRRVLDWFYLWFV